MNALRSIGALVLVAARTGRALFRMDLRELVRSLAGFGFDSLPLTFGVAMLAGATVVVQTSLYVQRFNARAFLGWAAGFALLWELGPLLVGLMMAARLGARNAAELATLSVGGQLEGLRGVSLDPYRLLIAPRLTAAFLSILGLSCIAFLTATAWEAIAAYFALGLPLRTFGGSFSSMLSMADVLAGLSKSGAFGLAIALISTTIGIRTEGGARAVGQAAASAVTFSCAAIFILDFVLTVLLSGGAK